MSMIIFSTKIKERKMISKKEKSFHCIASRAIGYFRWYTVFVCHFVVVVDFFLSGGNESCERLLVVSDDILSGGHLQIQVMVGNSNEWSDALVCIAISRWNNVLWLVARMVSNDWYISNQLVSINHIRFCSVMFKNDPE